MEVNTLRDIGDKIYYLGLGKLHYGEIMKINIEWGKIDSSSKGLHLKRFEKYYVGPMATIVWDYDSFSTKESLVETLLNNIIID